MKKISFFIIAIALTVPALGQQTPTRQTDEMKSLKEKSSYILGHNLIQDFRARQIDIDLERLLQGIRDAAEGKKSVLSDEEVISVMTAFRKQIEERERKVFAKLADKNLRDGEKFMRENAVKDDVKQVESGWQYRVLKQGSGDKPSLTDNVKLNIRGTFIDGKEFYVTDPKNPLVGSVGAVPVRGLMEALQRMPVGSKWEIVLPAKLAFGIEGTPVVGPNETLVYELELLEIVPKK